MATATFRFQLPEEDGEYRLATNGGKYYSALWNFGEVLRQLRKYGEGLDTGTLDKVLIAWRSATSDINWDEVS